MAWVTRRSSTTHVAFALSQDGGALFVTDQGNRKIRRVAVATGEVTTIAGSGEEGGADGVGDAAQFYIPSGIAISLDGGALFVADLANHKIRRVEVATGEVTTVAGSGTRGSADGVGDAAQFNGPAGIAISSDGSTLLVSSGDGFRQVCVAAPPPPPSFAPIFVPPSSLAADLAKTWGDKTLPEGKVTFLVGDDLERIEHVSKNVLCAARARLAGAGADVPGAAPRAALRAGAAGERRAGDRRAAARGGAHAWPTTPPRCGRAAAWSSCATLAWPTGCSATRSTRWRSSRARCTRSASRRAEKP